VVVSLLFGVEFLGKLYVKILKCKEIMLGLWYDNDLLLILWWCEMIWCNCTMSWGMYVWMYICDETVWTL